MIQAGVARSGAGEIQGDKLGKRPGDKLSELSPEEGRVGGQSLHREHHVQKCGGVKVKQQAPFMGTTNMFQQRVGDGWEGGGEREDGEERKENGTYSQG